MSAKVENVINSKGNRGNSCHCHDSDHGKHGHDHGHSHRDNTADGHGHCHHACGNNEGFTFRMFLMPVLSFIMMIAGIMFRHLHLAWFDNQVVDLIWFIVAFLPVGIPVMKESWEAILKKDIFNEFTLMIIACAGAFCIGEYPEAVGVMLFYTIGEIFQDRAVDKATRNISRLIDVRPQQTHVLRDGKLMTEAPQNVKVGESIEVRPGERVPLDGKLEDREASFDTSALTGESVPRTIKEGDDVLAGMIVTGSPVTIKVSKRYDDSTLAKILEMVKDASSRKAPAEMFVRRFARIYTPVVILLAILIVLIPALIGAVSPFHYVFREWLYRSLVFLVISCPCALVISVPLGYFAGIGAASRCGILFKGGNYLDAITHIDTVAFDKTGTLTTGTFGVTGTESGDIPERELLSYALSLEEKSTHPIARAVVSYVREKDIDPISPDNMEEISGQGITAMSNGKKILIGNLKLLEANGIVYPDYLKNTISTIVACAVGNRYAGALFLSDTLKKDASKAIAGLRHEGVKEIEILSGDKPEVVAHYAEELGIDKAYGGLLPQDKASHIRTLIEDKHRYVAFVGDGMNDAPVLALSNIGVAMGGLGSDAAVESADVVIQNDEPSKLVTAIRIGKATRSIVRNNITGAISIKIIVMIAGAIGFASLWSAVFADVGVALLAVLNSLRILYKKYD